MENDQQLRELYQSLILEYSRKSSFEGVLEEFTETQVGFNPSCGDKVVVYLQRQGDRIEKIRFVIEGSRVL